MPFATPITDYPSAVNFLRGLKARGVALGLERMRRFSSALGAPGEAVPCIHIAGTNGKGSVAAMVEAMLRAAGWRTGLYTSPHLVRLGERVQVNRQILSENEITGLVREMAPVAQRLEAESGEVAGPSYFEFMTVLALRHFQQQRCDIAVIEVGLGGRLDATNIVTPDVTVITSIGLDHCEVLGETVGAIAAEKAGILKPGCPVVIGRLPAEAESVVRKVAATLGNRVVSAVEEFGDELGRYPRTNLEGDYQRHNAATATLVAHALAPRWRLTDSLIKTALMEVDWPGRWQRCAVDGRTVIVDGTHNAEGAIALEANLVRLVAETGRAPIVVAGVLGLARARSLVEVLSRHARELHFVVPAQSRACSFEQLRDLVPATYAGRVVRSSVESAFPVTGKCAIGEAGDAIVVTGSLYLAGEVLSRIDPSRGPNEAHLQDF